MTLSGNAVGWLKMLEVKIHSRSIQEVASLPGMGELLDQRPPALPPQFTNEGERNENMVSYGECLASGICFQVVIYSVDADWSCQDQKVKNDFGTQNVLSNRECRHHSAINQGSQAESDFNDRVWKTTELGSDCRMTHSCRTTTSTELQILKSQQMVAEVL